VPDELVHDVCAAAQRLDVVTSSEAAALAEVLKYRKERIMHFLSSSSSMFPNIVGWTTP